VSEEEGRDLDIGYLVLNDLNSQSNLDTACPLDLIAQAQE
jgi:hypothetical protein